MKNRYSKSKGRLGVSKSRGKYIKQNEGFTSV